MSRKGSWGRTSRACTREWRTCTCSSTPVPWSCSPRAGCSSFISSNKWFRAGYGAKLRKHVGENAHVLSITDFGGLPVFESATAYPMIFVAEKSTRADRSGVLFAQPTSLDPPYPDIRAVLARSAVRLPPQAVQGSEWHLASAESSVRAGAMTGSGVPLDQYVGGKIYYGVKTGFNRAFVIDSAVRERLIDEDPRSAELIKRLAHGTDIRRWSFDVDDQWLIYAPWGLQVDRYPAVRAHLARWRPELEARPECRDGRYPWWCLARYGADYAGEFPKRKIVFPDIAKQPRFAFDPHGVYVANTAYMIPVEDFYLLGVLNSRAVERFYVDLSSQVRGGYLRFIRQYVERIPIPRAAPRDREAVAELAARCVEQGGEGAGVAEWEAEIDDRVASLYGLTARERAA